MEKLIVQQKKLVEEEENADKQILLLHGEMTRIQADLSAALGRIQRIRKIRSRVQHKARTEIARGMQELDKEDEIVPALDAHEHYLLEDAHFMGVTPETDLNSLGLGLDFSDLGPLFPVSAGETSLSGGGSSSNV